MTAYYAYLRDSGGEEQDLSIAQQKAALQTWAANHAVIIARYFVDEARTGSSLVGRAALQEMMNALRHGADVAGVVVWKYNRFARNIDNAQLYRAEIRSLGYTFTSLNDTVPEGPAGRVFEALIDYKDEQYLIDLSIDVKRGLRDLVSRYGCVPGVPPRGFMRQPVHIGARRDGSPHIGNRWVPDPATAPLVRQAFEMRASGASLGEIHAATHLYSSINSYRTFWPNRLYIGTLVFGDDLVIENYCPPIVDLPTWQAVQDIQGHYARSRHMTSESGYMHPRRQHSSYLLSGLVACARCGAPLAGNTSHQRNGSKMESYLCTRAYRTRDCVRHRIPKNVVEPAVINALKSHILTPKNMQTVYALIAAGQSGRLAEQQAQDDQLAARLAGLRRQVTNVVNAIAEGGRVAALLAKLQDLEAQERALLSQRAQLAAHAEQPAPLLPPAELQRRIGQIIALLDSTDTENKRSILRALIQAISVDRANNLIVGEITYYYPPPDPTDPNAYSPAVVTAPKSVTPSGPPRFTHSMAFAAQTKRKSHR